LFFENNNLGYEPNEGAFFIGKSRSYSFTSEYQFFGNGEVIAAISVSSYGITVDKFNDIGLAVKSSAAQLSRRMGSSETL
jgi:hypothetical protein